MNIAETEFFQNPIIIISNNKKNLFFIVIILHSGCRTFLLFKETNIVNNIYSAFSCIIIVTQKQMISSFLMEIVFKYVFLKLFLCWECTSEYTLIKKKLCIVIGLLVDLITYFPQISKFKIQVKAKISNVESCFLLEYWLKH